MTIDEGMIKLCYVYIQWHIISCYKEKSSCTWSGRTSFQDCVRRKVQQLFATVLILIAKKSERKLLEGSVVASARTHGPIGGLGFHEHQMDPSIF